MTTIAVNNSSACNKNCNFNPHGLFNLRCSEKQGRHYIANSNIKLGTIIAEEQVISIQPSQLFFTRECENIIRDVQNLHPLELKEQLFYQRDSVDISRSKISLND